MAVYAAHLTRTLQGTPSIFQVAAQDALGATVKPALRKVVEYLSALYPNRFGVVLDWYDELYLLFDSCLQYHYLKHYAASFSETFYGLYRVPTTVETEFAHNDRLPVNIERASLALLVLVPYVGDKLRHYAEKWRADAEDGKLGNSRADRARRAAARAFTTAHFAAEGARLAQLAAYASGAARAHSPALAALRLALRPAPPRSAQLADRPLSWRGLARALAAGEFAAAWAWRGPWAGGAVLRAAEYGAFLVQFLRWWEARHARAPAAAALPVPPPPPGSSDEKSMQFKNKCPLCLQPWKTPTVLPVSGYVFCYACISRHLRAQPACPRTRLPAAEDQLVRMYAPA